MILNPIPSLVQKVFPSDVVWRMPQNERSIYLTFDDGPVPQATPWVLNLLEKYSIKATFFMVGENVVKYPEIKSEVDLKGHSIGNHSFNHLNGWKTKNQDYFQNIEKAAPLTSNKLFRPPYGRITRQQTMTLSQQYKIVLWSLLSEDYKADKNPKEIVRNITKHCQPGTIIVFHDNPKAMRNLTQTLPPFIDFALQKGFDFAVF
ncbi:MAG: polysaccharide deacetylase family protein [Bacteroidales bacterium]|nr:polysaccharide deacetylase family protein [Bacteroidales bacterium]